MRSHQIAKRNPYFRLQENFLKKNKQFFRPCFFFFKTWQKSIHNTSGTAMIKHVGDVNRAAYAVVRGRAAQVPRKILPSFAEQRGLRTPDN